MASAQILIVEDQRTVAGALRTRLRGLGYDVTGIASSGVEAVSKAEELLPDLVLMDIKLGEGMDGIEAAQKIKSVLNIPIVYVSAYADPDIINRAKQTIPAGFINKPFSTKDLLTTIDLALYSFHRNLAGAEGNQVAVAPAEPTRIAEPLATDPSVGDPVITSDLDGIITFVNLAAETRTGWKRKHLIGGPLRDVLMRLYDLSESQVQHFLRQVREHGIEQVLGSANIGTRISRSGEDVLTPLRDAHGTLFGMALRLGENTVKQRFAEVVDELFALRAALDPFPAGVVLVTQQMRIIFQNRPAQEILEAQIGLRSRDNFLIATDKEVDAQLRAYVADVARATGSVPAGAAAGALQIRDPLGRRRLELVVVPARSGNDSVNSPVAALFVFETSWSAKVSTDLLRDLYRLTSTEIQLIVFLMEGQTIDGCAQALAISINTVRTHLKHVYQKIGVNRHTELVQRIGRGPAGLIFGTHNAH